MKRRAPPGDGKIPIIKQAEDIYRPVEAARRWASFNVPAGPRRATAHWHGQPELWAGGTPHGRAPIGAGNGAPEAPGPRRAMPGLASVCLPPATTIWPFTRT